MFCMQVAVTSPMTFILLDLIHQTRGYDLAGHWPGIQKLVGHLCLLDETTCVPRGNLPNRKVK